MTTLWQVNFVHTPWVGHGYEPVALFSTRALAEAYRDRCVRENGQNMAAAPETFGYGYEVEEVTVDDPAIVASMGEGD
jgi:hypothetical protein